MGSYDIKKYDLTRAERVVSTTVIILSSCIAPLSISWEEVGEDSVKAWLNHTHTALVESTTAAKLEFKVRSFL